MLKVTELDPTEVKLSIPVGDGSFILTVKRPGIGDLADDEAALHATSAQCHPSRFTIDDVSLNRRLGFVVGWTDLIGPDDKPLPFSPQTLRSVVAKYGAVRGPVAAALNQLFSA